MVDSDGREPAIELRAVEKRYGGTVAVDALDLSIPRGSTYGLLGPNGAGKTSTIRMVMQIIEPDRGEVRLFGEPAGRRALDRIGYLPEERGVYRRMRVVDFLSFIGELKGLRPADSRPKIMGWLERLDLADRARSRVQELSKGMQQKIQFIGAILHDPEVVILDEPFSGLDPINQQVLKDIIGELKARRRTILFSTHIIGNAERTCDHVCIIANGAKVVDGELETVRREHGGNYLAVTVESWTPEIAGLLRGLPGVVDMHEHGNEAELSLGESADPHAILQELVRRDVRLRRFERVQPSLEKIFVERVGAPAESSLRAKDAREVAAHV